MYYFDLLQIFADGGGDGGSAGAAPAGASEAAAPAESYESKLEALGVPKDKIRKRSKAGAAAAPLQQTGESAAKMQQTPTNEQDDAAQRVESHKSPEKEEKAKPTWDELMADPDYNKQMQKVVTDRLKKSKAAEDQLNKLAPAMEVLARYYNVDVKDTDAIISAINDDNRMYEGKADQLGIPVEAAKRMDQLERADQRHREQDAETEAQNQLMRHIEGLRQEGEELKKTFPNFDLQNELQNPIFRRMTAPGSGLTVADAYYAVHRKEIQAAAAQVTAQQVAEKLSNSIQANSRRPTEAGTAAQAPTVTSFDYTKMSKDQRADLKRRIREAAARGEKLYPGQ